MDQSEEHALDFLKSPLDAPTEIIAEEISKNLHEPNVALVCEAVSQLGNKKSIEFYNEVMKIESKGGLLTTDGTRRRTPGGIFFYLINHDNLIKRDVKKQIFGSTTKLQRETKIQATREKRRRQNKELKELLVKEGLLMLNNPKKARDD